MNSPLVNSVVPYTENSLTHFARSTDSTEVRLSPAGEDDEEGVMVRVFVAGEGLTLLSPDAVSMFMPINARIPNPPPQRTTSKTRMPRTHSQALDDFLGGALYGAGEVHG